MEEFSLVEVNDKKPRKEFLVFPVRLYKNEKNWIRPLDVDVERVFDPKNNKSFIEGECIRWLLRNSMGETAGRVAAFYNRVVAGNNDQPTGGMGFFECVNDRDAAFMLFDACREWLAGKGMEAMDGPVNFGERDRWWGLLVDGFSEPNYCMNYNLPYYRELFEAYGFQNYFNQYTYQRPLVREGLNPIIMEKANRIRSNSRYSFRQIDRRNLDKAAEDFCTIYNQAWVRHSGVKEITKSDILKLYKSIEPIMEEQLIWFAFYNDNPIGFFIMLPEFNQIVKHLNGRLDIAGKIRFLYHRWRKTCDKVFGLLFGVIPRFQGKGIEGALAMAYGDIAFNPGYHYKSIELNWVGDFNPAMMKLMRQLDLHVIKTHVTYRYLFDREKEFKRAKILA